MRIGIVTLAAVTAMLAVLASGCGGGSKKSSASGATTTSAVTTAAATTAAATTAATGGTVPLSQWADGFCGAVYDWAVAVRSAGQSLRGNPSKANLQASAGKIQSADDKLVSDLQGLGTPDTPNGAAAKQAIDSLASALKTHAAAIKSAITGLSSAGQLKAASAALSTNLIAMGTAFQGSLSQLKALSASSKQNFKQAFQGSSSCKKLQAQGAG